MTADAPTRPGTGGTMSKASTFPCFAGSSRSPTARNPECCPRRLHQKGQILGGGPDVLYVRFAGEGQLISVPPELLRRLPHEPDERWW